MTTHEYAQAHGIKSEEDWRNHFRNNMLTGKLPVAIASCPKCDEIIWDYHIPGAHKCPIKNANY